MIEKISDMTIGEIKEGYTFDAEAQEYVCCICGRSFEKGEIFEVEGRYFEAEKMIKLHLQKEHGGALNSLVSLDKKLTGITENQKELLTMIYSGMTDNEISKKTGVASATIRHQRFTFREKAKQAKLYLAIYELAFEGAQKNKGILSSRDEIIEVHKGAKMVDDRYFTTKAEEEQILATMFYSLSPLRLKTFSSKEKKKIVILKKIAEELEINKKYSERELNDILKDIYEDFATLRRYLIEYGFMERTNDCSEYWLK